MKPLKGKRMELAIRPARFSCSRFATCTLSIRMDETCAGAMCALLASERQRRLSTGDKDTRKVDRSSRPVVKPRARIVRPWLLQRLPGWCLERSVRHVDRGGRHTCALKLLPVDRTMFAHYASKMLTAIRLHPTGLEIRTKESNMCASLRVIETRGHNESKDRPRRLR